MAFSSSALSPASSSSSFLSSFPHTYTRSKTHLRFPSIRFIKAASEPEKGNPTATQTKKAEESTSAQPQSQAPAAKPLPKKPVYSMKKGQIVRVDKEKYLNSVNYLSVGHPPYYKGLDYIYEDRGEVLDLRIFETGEYALVAWVGIPTAPAWLPTDMLIESEKLKYERL
ncbi:NAD(P)H:plastoquinone dehydrogenase complex subunit O, NADH dehydrogenase-like complex) [Hibiscus trionum]|uniref:NAD(P)H:plastoquinone dehydrogenase complex subunit O, NADH dehydrogenase-like complex n=1 Tax=Hibiscus trionum TaxID=183268 RepID=A0A9W7J0Q2_HIBTR|nr:NAD(P)H:plastoquinone dehydrogenase complex subunit O, NADH dehydrogenase-like complex) [Hibiscus trionum]